jgi:hypothetical protein
MRASPAIRVIALALIAVAIQALVVTAYAWPAARLALRHLPVVVAGPAGPAAALAAEFARRHPGAFDVITAPDQSAARRVIAGRGAYGAVVVDGKAPLVLTASAPARRWRRLWASSPASRPGRGPRSVMSCRPTRTTCAGRRSPGCCCRL